LLLKAVTGVKLIPEIMNAPERAYLKEEPNPGIRGRLWHIYSTVCLHLTVFFCDRVHLLYPGQLASYPLLRRKKASVFHDFTTVTGVEVQTHADDNNQCMLLAGSPWFRKGADLAIGAFKRLAADFPLAVLQIAGHFPDGVPQVLADGCPGIKVLGNVPHDRLMQLASQSSIMLLPSRNEGLPRILIEGMAAGLALVGSDVAGIPYLIRNGENGFIFPDCDIPALEQCLRRLLSDASLRRRMGQRSYELSRATLTDDAYATQFARMIADAVTIADTADRRTA
jgi:glycosyltransferase involved in cell wall biosynthesis